MYCLHQLALLNNLRSQADNRKYQITLFETAENVGGRISTHRIYKDLEAEDCNIPRMKQLKDLEFYLEYGPMRLELDQQILLKHLLTTFHIKEVDDQELSIKNNKPFLVNFDKYKSESTDSERMYQSYGAEAEQKNGLDLLKLALVRIFLSVELTTGSSYEERLFNESVTRLRRTLQNTKYKWEDLIMEPSFSAEHERWRKELDEWISKRTERDYQNFREFAKMGGVYLYEMGFWNLLSDLMSHNAVSKMSELGTFYHLIPENPNAIEWIIFWLRNFKSSEMLKGIYGGMQCIVDELKIAIETNGVNWANQVKLGHTLRSVSTEGDKVTLEFADGARESNFDHVILALPYWPLKRLAIRNDQLFTADVVEDLDAVFGFPLSKCFVGVKKAWWRLRRTDEEMTNRGALQFPTREVHYMTSKRCKEKGIIERDKLEAGAIMAYADRPATAFWGNYVKKQGSQVRPECWSARDGDTSKKNSRLIKKLVNLIQENAPNKLNFSESDIIFYGIRDWGREPYGGAAHYWRPERKSWEVLARLGAFTINELSRPNFHVCGEAYSDYQGFIEGSLRSAAYVLHHIDDRFMKHLSKDLGSEHKEYFKDLEGWVKRLDETRQELGT